MIYKIARYAYCHWMLSINMHGMTMVSESLCNYIQGCLKFNLVLGKMGEVETDLQMSLNMVKLILIYPAINNRNKTLQH